MSDDDRRPGLDAVLDILLEEALESARSMLPARVTAYDPDKQRASIQILIQKAHITELEERAVETLPEIHGVPVKFIGAQATGRITVPVGVGDQGMAIFASASIARWKLRGGIVDPGDDRRHDINDCVFDPGLHDFDHVPTTAPTDAIVTHGLSRIGGPDATEAIVVQSALNVFGLALNTAITACIAANPIAAPALEALRTALGTDPFTGLGWGAGTTLGKAK